MRLLEIAISCQNMTVQTAWFASHGWLVKDHQVRIGHSKLIFKPSSTAHTYHYALIVPTNSIGAAVRWCNDHDIPLLSVHGHTPIYEFAEWGMQGIYFFDGAGNVGEFIGASDSSQQSPEAFDISMILGIGEIGIVEADVPHIASTFKKTYDLESFHSYSHSFHAVGDTEGRIIFVEHAREWYPQTGVYSTSAPVELTFSVQGQIHHFTKNAELC